MVQMRLNVQPSGERMCVRWPGALFKSRGERRDKTGRAIRLIVKMRSTSRTYCGTITSGPVTFLPSRCASSVISLGGEFN